MPMILPAIFYWTWLSWYASFEALSQSDSAMAVVETNSESMMIIECNSEAMGYMKREPSTSTLAYYPLNSTSTTSDLSWKWNNLSNSWGTFWTNWVYLNGSSYLSMSNYINGLSTWTFAFRVKPSSSWTVFWRQYNGVWSWPVIWIGWGQINSGAWSDGTANYVYVWTYNEWGRINSWEAISTSERTCVVITWNSTQAKLYLNGELKKTESGNFTIQSWNNYTWMRLGMRWGHGWGHNLTWYIGTFVVENIVNDDSWALDFYRRTRLKYLS